MTSLNTHNQMEILLDTNLVNAIIQADKKTIERVISMGASITKRHRTEHEMRDAIFTTIYFQDADMLDFILQTHQKYHNELNLREQEIAEYLNLHFENDNVKVLEVLKKHDLLMPFYKKRSDLFYENFMFAPKSLLFMMGEMDDLLDDANVFQKLSHYIGISLEVEDHVCVPSMKEVLNIIYHEKPNLFNEFIICGLEYMVRVFKPNSTNEDMLSHLIDLGFDLKTPLKDLAPQNHSHYMVKYEDNSILDLIQDLEIKARLEQKVLDKSINNNNNNSKIKKLKV